VSDTIHAQLLSYGNVGTLPPFEFDDFALMDEGLFDGPGNGPNPRSTTQGNNGFGIGDCWFVAAAAGLAQQRPAAIVNMFSQTDDQINYHVTLPSFSRTATVRIAPTDTHIYSHANGDWLMALEKAYAQDVAAATTFQTTADAYYYIDSAGLASTGIHTLTGHDVTTQTFGVTRNSVTRQMLTAALSGSNHKVVTASTSPFAPQGLVARHVYTVVAYESGLVELRNPWGQNRHFAIPGDGDYWLGKESQLGQDNGYFWMKLSDFTSAFFSISYEQDQ
jgi:hypothetical protein